MCGKAVIVPVNCDSRIACQRNIERQDPVPDESFARLCRQFELLRTALTINSEHAEPERAAERIISSIQGVRTTL